MPGIVKQHSVTTERSVTLRRGRANAFRASSANGQDLTAQTVLRAIGVLSAHFFAPATITAPATKSQGNATASLTMTMEGGAVETAAFAPAVTLVVVVCQ